ncbi:MAG TPA: YhbY family RNA-binding protein [Candidatus Binatia bacterium]|nr:YhbY family RNA-binding protein [Candidatus Binatia bacterium]
MPTINIGKSGVTENTINEIAKQLDRHGTVRVKLLTAAGERKALMERITSELNAKVVSSIGFVMVLEKA